MTRLPSPGSDSGNWGKILNDFLTQAHQNNGALKVNTVGTTQLQDGSVTIDKLDTATQATVATAVKSVNGKTPNTAGAVSLTATDVGALTQTTADGRYLAGVKQTTAPSSPATNDLWYDSTNDIWKRWNGSAWVAAGVTQASLTSQLSSYVPSTTFQLKSNILNRHEPRNRRIGSVTSDITSVTAGITADGTLTNTYTWPGLSSGTGSRVLTGTEYSGLAVDPGPSYQHYSMRTAGINYLYPNYSSQPPMRSIRFMTDAPKVQVLLWNTLGTMTYQVFIDDAPVTLTSQQYSGTTFYLPIVLPSSKTRKIEIRTQALLGPMAIAPTYKIWQPAPQREPRLLTVGDSYSAALTWTAAGGTGSLDGMVQGIEDLVNIEQHLIDAIGGTGFIARNSGGPGGPNNNYLDRIASHIALAPDVLWIPNGCANDLATSNTVSATAAAVVSYFTQIRTALPNCRLIYGDGFTPPVTFGGFAANYAAVRESARSSLTNVGVYYIDTTTSPWLDGTTGGYIPGHTTGAGNTDRYVGFDGIHLVNPDGKDYLKNRLAPKLHRIMKDDGTLINTAI